MAKKTDVVKLAETIVMNADYLSTCVERGDKINFWGGWLRQGKEFDRSASKESLHRQIVSLRDMLLVLDKEIAKAHKF